MDDLPHIALTKFNKLKKKEHLFNDSVYLCFIFSFHFQHIFRLSLAGRLIYTCFRTIFLTLSQKIVVNCMRWVVKIMCFNIITFIFNVVTLIFFVLAVKENMEQKEELTYRFKTDVKNLKNSDLSSRKSQTFTL